MTFQKATKADAPHVYDILSEYQAANVPWADQANLRSTIDAAIDHPDCLVLSGRRCAFVATAFDSPWAGRLAAEQVVVAEGEKGQFDAVIRSYEAWARDQKCRASALGYTAATPGDSSKFKLFERVYRRVGYLPYEMTFIKLL